MAVAGLPFEVQTLAFIGQNVQGQASWPHRPVEIVPAGNERELSKVTAPFDACHFSNVNYSKQYINNTLIYIELWVCHSSVLPSTCRVPHLGESGVFGVFLV